MSGFKRIFIFLLIAVFMVSHMISPLQAQGVSLPAVGSMVTTSGVFNPTVLKGLEINQDNPFRFGFIVDPGEQSNIAPQDQEKLIKYFLTALTIKEKDLWVNLSPHEENRIIEHSFGETEMGRDLLVQDYLLKQLTSSLMYPEGELGQKFWQRVYEQAYEKYGITDVPRDTFHKVWIIPDYADVYAQDNTVLIGDAHLKVMLEEDYFDTKVAGHRSLSTEIMREVIIPEIEHEVNNGEQFVPLRQIYHAMILATWFKKNLKESLLGQVYADQNKIYGTTNDDPKVIQSIYDQYLQAFEKGVYDYIKEEYDPYLNETIPRKYFSGGFTALGVDNSMNSHPLSRFPEQTSHLKTMDTAFMPDGAPDKDVAMRTRAMLGIVAGVTLLGWILGLNKDEPKPLAKPTAQSNQTAAIAKRAKARDKQENKASIKQALQPSQWNRRTANFFHMMVENDDQTAFFRALGLDWETSYTESFLSWLGHADLRDFLTQSQTIQSEYEGNLINILSSQTQLPYIANEGEKSVLEALDRIRYVDDNQIQDLFDQLGVTVSQERMDAIYKTRRDYHNKLDGLMASVKDNRGVAFALGAALEVQSAIASRHQLHLPISSLIFMLLHHDDMKDELDISYKRLGQANFQATVTMLDSAHPFYHLAYRMSDWESVQDMMGFINFVSEKQRIQHAHSQASDIRAKFVGFERQVRDLKKYQYKPLKTVKDLFYEFMNQTRNKSRDEQKVLFDQFIQKAEKAIEQESQLFASPEAKAEFDPSEDELPINLFKSHFEDFVAKARGIMQRSGQEDQNRLNALFAVFVDSEGNDLLYPSLLREQRTQGKGCLHFLPQLLNPNIKIEEMESAYTLLQQRMSPQQALDVVLSLLRIESSLYFSSDTAIFFGKLSEYNQATFVEQWDKISNMAAIFLLPEVQKNPLLLTRFNWFDVSEVENWVRKTYPKFTSKGVILSLGGILNLEYIHGIFPSLSIEEITRLMQNSPFTWESISFWEDIEKRGGILIKSKEFKSRRIPGAYSLWSKAKRRMVINYLVEQAEQDQRQDLERLLQIEKQLKGRAISAQERGRLEQEQKDISQQIRGRKSVKEHSLSNAYDHSGFYRDKPIRDIIPQALNTSRSSGISLMPSLPLNEASVGFVPPILDIALPEPTPAQDLFLDDQVLSVLMEMEERDFMSNRQDEEPNVERVNVIGIILEALRDQFLARDPSPSWEVDLEYYEEARKLLKDAGYGVELSNENLYLILKNLLGHRDIFFLEPDRYPQEQSDPAMQSYGGVNFDAALLTLRQQGEINQVTQEKLIAQFKNLDFDGLRFYILNIEPFTLTIR